MIEAAGSGVREGSGERRTSVLAVTVLTSLDASDLAELGFADPSELVSRWARLAVDAGADGVVASAREAASLRSSLGPDALIVTPGIRMPGGEEDDQRRVSHPATALAAGADLLVVGRPITGAADPVAAARAVLAAMAAGS
jgi:orotidine-5'-phosphate decarboxylase